MQRLRWRDGVDLEHDVLELIVASPSGAIQIFGDECADRQQLDVVCDGFGQPERQRPFLVAQGVGLVEEGERQPDLAQAGLSNRVLSKQNDNRLVSGVRRG